MPQQKLEIFSKKTSNLDADFSNEISRISTLGWAIKSFNTNIVTTLGGQGNPTYHTVVLTVLFEKP